RRLQPAATLHPGGPRRWLSPPVRSGHLVSGAQPGRAPLAGAAAPGCAIPGADIPGRPRAPGASPGGWPGTVGTTGCRGGRTAFAGTARGRTADGAALAPRGAV